MAQPAPGANAAAHPLLAPLPPPAVGAVGAAPPHKPTLILAQSDSAKWLWAFFERNWEHWGPVHTLPRHHSPKWHGDAEAELTSFLASNNHNFGQVKRQLRLFKRQQCAQLGPSARATATVTDLRQSHHTRMPSLGAVAQDAIKALLSAKGLCTCAPRLPLPAPPSPLPPWSPCT